MGRIIDPTTAFERVFVVNLDRRPDRWKAFAEGLPDDWPFPAPERVSGVDAQRVKSPTAWKAGGGAWGIYRSFLGIIERCMNEGVQSVLMLEDDALFCERFTERVSGWLRLAPADWGMLYLGGQHCRENVAVPRRLSLQVFQPFNVNRCHAWALQGKMLAEVYEYLTRPDWPTYTWNGEQKASHIDHYLGFFHEQQYRQKTGRVICPHEWFVGQRKDKSNICGKDLEDRVWMGAKGLVRRKRKRKPGMRKYLFTGHPRSGTKYIAKLAQAYGQHVWHEAMNRDGISSWFMAADDPNPPYGKKVARSRFKFQTIVHLVRDPIRVIASTIYTEDASKTSLAYRIKHAPAIGEATDKFERAVRSLLEWTKLIEALPVMHVQHVETAATELPARFGWTEKIHTLPAPSVNARTHPALTWSELTGHLSDATLAELRAYAQKIRLPRLRW